MAKWEYQITRHNLTDLVEEEAGGGKASFFCNQKGQCILHDASDQAAETIRQFLNEEGRKGWQLVQFGYHLGEIMCVWKRSVES